MKTALALAAAVWWCWEPIASFLWLAFFFWIAASVVGG